MPLIPPNRIVVFPLKDDLQWYDPEVVFRPFDDLFGRGVMGPTDLQVIANAPADGQITVQAGRGYVPYTSGGKRYFSTPVDIRSSDPEFQRSIQSWPGGNPRIDRVVAKILDATMTPGDIQKGGVFDVIPGTPTAGATLVNLSGAASVPGNSVLLGNVLANGATVPTGNIDTTFGVVRTKAIIGLGNAPTPVTAFEKNGTVLTTRGKLNFIEGTGVTITATDDPANDETDLSFSVVPPTPPDAKLLFNYQVAGSAKASIDTYADAGNVLLPQTYRSLLIHGYVAGTAAGNDGIFFCRVNNDSGTNYDYAQGHALGGNFTWVTDSANTDATQWQLGFQPHASIAERFTGFQMVIPNYAYLGTTGTNPRSIFFLKGLEPIQFNTSSAGTTVLESAGTWHPSFSTVGVNRLLFYPATGNFRIGTRISVWGI